MKIDNFEIPRFIVDAWLAQVENFQPDDLRKLAMGRPSLLQGFRRDSFKIEVVRERVKSILKTSSELPSDIRDYLRGSGLAQSLLIVFSEKAIKEIAEPLAVFFGYEETVSAMLLDERQSVRAMGLVLADRAENLASVKSKDDSFDRISYEIRPFLFHIQSFLQYKDRLSLKIAEKNDKTANSKDGKTTFLNKVPKSRKEAELISNLRKKRQDVNRLHKEVSVLTSRLNNFSNNDKILSASLSETRDQLKFTQAELEILKSQFETKVNDGIYARLDRKLFPWLEPVKELEKISLSLNISSPTQALGSSSSDDSQKSEQILFAESLLRRQSELDRRYGLRSSLKAEISRCAALIDCLREAQIDSLRPMAELSDGISVLENRISRINEALGIDASDFKIGDSNIRRIESVIAHSDSLEKLSLLRQQLIASESLGLLNDEDIKEAYRLLARATSTAYASISLESGWTVGRENLINLPLQELQVILSEGGQAVLVVDGHNVLWKVSRLFKKEFENGQPGPKARKVLEVALLSLAKNYPKLNVELWFDSRDAEDRTITENFHVHFSGGKGSNRADLQMLQYLAHIKTTRHDLLCVVATADMEVATGSKDVGALVITPHELANWFV